MKLPITLYDALIAANVPTEKARSVAEVWETDVEMLATKADLRQVETRLNASLTELRSDMKIMRWQLGAIFVCVVVPLLKFCFDLIVQAKL
jgi:hypothetical protein